MLEDASPCASVNVMSLEAVSTVVESVELVSLAVVSAVTFEEESVELSSTVSFLKAALAAVVEAEEVLVAVCGAVLLSRLSTVALLVAAAVTGRVPLVELF